MTRRTPDSLEDTYWGRVRRMASILDVSNVFVTDAQLERAHEVVRRFEFGRSSANFVRETATELTLLAERPSEEEYRRAKSVVDAVLHPDTGLKIRLPLRVSMILPMNLTLDAIMIQAQHFPSLWAPIGAHTLNQTYNIMHYWANRNASNDSEQTHEKMIKAYAGALTASVGTAVGMTYAVDNARWPTHKQVWITARKLSRRSVPLWAVAAADFINLRIMRQNEIELGVDVRSLSGQVLGKSQVAGAMAVNRCIIGRIAAAAPILTLPSLVVHSLERAADRAHHQTCDRARTLSVFVRLGEQLARRPWMRFPLLMGLCGISIQVFVPLFFGMYRQTQTVDVHELEPRFHSLLDERGAPITRVWFNKGI